MADKKRLIEIPSDGIVRIPINSGQDTVGEKRIDLSHFPTVDAVEVVRCKDCRFSAQHDPYDPMECVKWATKWGVVYTTPDGYCHKGERRTDE